MGRAMFCRSLKKSGIVCSISHYISYIIIQYIRAMFCRSLEATVMYLSTDYINMYLSGGRWDKAMFCKSLERAVMLQSAECISMYMPGNRWDRVMFCRSLKGQLCYNLQNITIYHSSRAHRSKVLWDS